MIPKTCLLIFSAIYLGNSFAQTQDYVKPKPKSEPTTILLILSNGYSNARGNYAAKNLDNKSDGFATGGYFLNFTTVLKLAPVIGVCASYHYQFNGLDTKSMNQQLNSRYISDDFATESSSWIARGFYAGLYLDLPVSDLGGFSVYASAQIGLPTYVSPSVKSSGTYKNTTLVLQQNSSRTSAAGYMASLGLQKKIYEVIFLHAGVGYLYGQATFKDVYSADNRGNFSISNFNQKFESLNFQAGLTIRLN